MHVHLSRYIYYTHSTPSSVHRTHVLVHIFYTLVQTMFISHLHMSTWMNQLVIFGISTFPYSCGQFSVAANNSISHGEALGIVLVLKGGTFLCFREVRLSENLPIFQLVSTMQHYLLSADFQLMVAIFVRQSSHMNSTIIL